MAKKTKQLKFPEIPPKIKRIAILYLNENYLLYGIKDNIFYVFEWDGFSPSFNKMWEFVNKKEML